MGSWMAWPFSLRITWRRDSVVFSLHTEMVREWPLMSRSTRRPPLKQKKPAPRAHRTGFRPDQLDEIPRSGHPPVGCSPEVPRLRFVGPAQITKPKHFEHLHQPSHPRPWLPKSPPEQRIPSPEGTMFPPPYPLRQRIDPSKPHRKQICPTHPGHAVTRAALTPCDNRGVANLPPELGTIFAVANAPATAIWPIVETCRWRSHLPLGRFIVTR